VTTSKFYRISGESTQHRGIVPDLEYPDMYDRESIGESTLKDALPWDVIGAVPHFTYGDIASYKAQLRSSYKARMERDPDYVYMNEMNEYLKASREKTRVSLKLSTRIKEKKKAEDDRLAIENRLLKASPSRASMTSTRTRMTPSRGPNRPSKTRNWSRAGTYWSTSSRSGARKTGQEPSG